MARKRTKKRGKAPGKDKAQSKRPISAAATALLAVFHLVASVVTHLHKVGGAVTYVVGVIVFHKPIGALLKRYLVEAWRAIDKEAAEERAANPQQAFDYRPIVVLCTSAIALTVINFYGRRGVYYSFTQGTSFVGHHFYELGGYAYWALSRLALYVIFPWIVVRALLRDRMRDYGMSTAGFASHLWIYGVLFLIALPSLIMVSYTKPFVSTYPFYKLSSRSWTDFLLWELFYGMQFFALEVFFRGFMLHPLKRSLGSASIFVMSVPYCMIHFRKPVAEAFGAIAAGVVLGTMSLRTRSIWAGVLIHMTVAICMDLLALFHTVGYPGNPRIVP